MPSALPKARKTGWGQSPLKQYSRDLRRITIPSKQEYAELFREYKKTRNPAKKTELKKRIAEGILPFIIQIVGRQWTKVYHLRGKKFSSAISLEDLIQSANERLLTYIIDDYEPNKGAAFTTYVEKSIRNHVRRIVDTEGPHLTLPFAVEERRRDTGLAQQFEREHGRAARSAKEFRAFAIKSGIKNPNRVSRPTHSTRVYVADIREPLSLDAPVPIDHSAQTSDKLFHDIIRDKRKPLKPQFDYIEEREHRKLIRKAVAGLSGKQKQLMEMALLPGENPKTVKYFASRLGITREGTRRIWADARVNMVKQFPELREVIPTQFGSIQPGDISKRTLTLRQRKELTKTIENFSGLEQRIIRITFLGPRILSEVEAADAALIPIVRISGAIRRIREYARKGNNQTLKSVFGKHRKRPKK